MKPYVKENKRKAEYPIAQIFLDRWSPRAISPEISEEQLYSLFEAARWAPSSSNKQPWHFLYTLQGDNHWNTFFSLLVEFNQMWAKNAGALVVILSQKDQKTGSFDAGAAWQNFALQARTMNLIAHGMAGFDYEKAREALKVPDTMNVEAMIAVGAQGSIEELHERMQKQEEPNTRDLISRHITRGTL